MSRVVLTLIFVFVAATPALSQDRTRVDLYDAQSQRQGYAIVDEKTGRVDTYDKDSKRTGYGVIQPDGRMDRYRLDGLRDGSTMPALQGWKR